MTTILGTCKNHYKNSV